MNILNRIKQNKFSKHLLIYFFGFLLVVNGVLGFLLMNQSISSLKEQVNDRMLDISNTAAALLDGDVMARLQKEDVETAEYQDALKILRTFQNQVQLDYIYGVRDLGNKNFVFTIDPEQDSPAEFGEEIVYSDALYDASLGNAAVDTEPSEDQWGRFYSSFSPIFDSKGNVSGIVGVDFNADWYDNQVRRHINIIFFACIFSLLGGAGIVFLLFGQLHKRFTILNGEMEKMTEEVKELAEELSLTTNSQEASSSDSEKPETQDLLEKFDEKLHCIRGQLKDYIGRAHTMAYTDALTGIGNRNAYLETIKALDEKIKVGYANFAMAIFDINGLKNANDDLGHEFGDELIIATASILMETFEKREVFRIGGDEFIAIVESISEENMDKAFREISKKFHDKIILKKDKVLELAVSKGYSIFQKDDEDVKTVFRRADDKMYEDKAAYYSSHKDRRRKR